jgi:hypothetical protein
MANPLMSLSVLERIGGSEDKHNGWKTGDIDRKAG